MVHLIRLIVVVVVVADCRLLHIVFVLPEIRLNTSGAASDGCWTTSGQKM